MTSMCKPFVKERTPVILRRLMLLAAGLFLYSFVFQAQVLAQSTPQADFFMGEGLYINKHYDQALEYYQSAYVNLITTQSDSSTLQKVLERLVTVTAYLKKNRLNKTYRAQLKSMFNKGSDVSVPGPSSIASSSDYQSQASSKEVSSTAYSFENSGSESHSSNSSFEPSDLKVQILLYYGSYEPHEIIRYLSVEEKDDFNSDKESLIQRVVLQSKQEFAAQKGYSINRFGSDNYKMLQIRDAKYRVYDSDWGRTLLDSEEHSDDSRDFWDDY